MLVLYATLHLNLSQRNFKASSVLPDATRSNPLSPSLLLSASILRLRRSLLVRILFVAFSSFVFVLVLLTTPRASLFSPNLDKRTYSYLLFAVKSGRLASGVASQPFSPLAPRNLRQTEARRLRILHRSQEQATTLSARVSHQLGDSRPHSTPKPAR